MIHMNRNEMITRACKAVLVVLACWLMLVLLQCLRWTGIINLNIGAGAQVQPAIWSAETKVLTIQYIELVGYLLSSLFMIGMSGSLMLRCINDLKRKKIFNRQNARRLWMITVGSFFFELFSSNLFILFGVREIQFGSNLLVTPLMFLVITLLYDAAVSVSEENELTI